MNKLRLSFFSILIGATTLLAHAVENPYKIEDALDQNIRLGLHQLYDLNFDEAKTTFESIQDRADEHPIVAFCLSSVYWWHASVDVTENDKNASRPFLTAAGRCLRISIKKIREGDRTGEAYIAAGSTYALLARWEAANHNWMAVYQREKKARVYLRKALKINPAAIDANMGLGIFEYALSTMPKIVRMLPGAGASGDPQVGLRQLQSAADHGTYLRLPATFFIASIYSEDLKSPHKTVEILSTLRGEFPSSPFVDFMMFIALYNGGCSTEMEFEAAEYELRVKEGQYRPEFSAQAHFFRALTSFKLHQWEQATAAFDETIRSANDTGPFKVWATLYKGYTLDLRGKREEALECYRWVANERTRWKSSEFARARIDTPFKETDRELETLLL